MSDTMTPMQRFLTTLNNKEPDRVPLFLTLTMHGAKELGMTIEKYYSKVEHVVEGQLRMQEKYNNDGFYAFQYAAMDTEPWGGKVVFIKNGPPNSGKPIISCPEQIMDLEVPDPLSSPAVVRMLEVIRTLKARAKDDIPVVGCAMSPFSLPVMQMGFDKYLDLIYEHPDEFKQLMSLNEEFFVRWVNAQFEAGATTVVDFDPVSSITITPPSLSLKTSFPITRRVIKRVNGPMLIHFGAGRCSPLLDDVMTLGVPAVGVSVLEELAELKKICAGKLCLVGSLNGIEMRRWTRTEAHKITKQAIAEAGVGGGYILSDNHGEIPYQVPEETLLEISRTVKTWGRYPLDWTTSPKIHPKKRLKSEIAIEKGPDQFADYAMAFDVLGSLGEITSEKSVVEQILMLYEMLTGAKMIAYLPDQGGPSSIQYSGASVPGKDTYKLLSTLSIPYCLTKNNRGFIFKILDNHEHYGTLIVEKAFTKSKVSQYLNLSLNLSKVFALALSNTRKFATLRLREKTLKETHQQLLHSEKLSALGKLTGSISHELNNPLYGVTCIIEQIHKEASLNSKEKDLLLLAVKECERMAGLVVKLRNFYQPSSETLKYLDVCKIIDDVIALLSKKLEERNIFLEKQYTSNLPKVQIVRDQFMQVMLNIIQNAEESISTEGGRIVVAVETVGANIEIRIQDSGEGVLPENFIHIFEPFYTTKGIKGTGLGLSVCYGIIKDWGGDIEGWSELGKGTRFTITLPIEKGET